MQFDIDEQNYTKASEVLEAFKIWRGCAVACVGREKVRQIEEHYLEIKESLDKMYNAKS
jgi:hypothetical protein